MLGSGGGLLDLPWCQAEAFGQLCGHLARLPVQRCVCVECLLPYPLPQRVTSIVECYHQRWTIRGVESPFFRGYKDDAAGEILKQLQTAVTDATGTATFHPIPIAALPLLRLTIQRGPDEDTA